MLLKEQNLNENQKMLLKILNKNKENYYKENLLKLIWIVGQRIHLSEDCKLNEITDYQLLEVLNIFIEKHKWEPMICS